MSTFHLTVFLMIPIYFVARSKPWDKRIGLFIIGIIFICIFAEPFFGGVDSALENTAYAGAMSQFDEDDGVNPLRVLLYAIPPVISYIFREKIEKYNEKNPMLNICVNMSLITAALYLVGMFTSGVLIGRLPIYTEVYDLILIPYLLHICVDKKSRAVITGVVIVVLLLYFYLTGPVVYHSDLTKTVGALF